MSIACEQICRFVDIEKAPICFLLSLPFTAQRASSSDGLYSPVGESGRRLGYIRSGRIVGSICGGAFLRFVRSCHCFGRMSAFAMQKTHITKSTAARHKRKPNAKPAFIFSAGRRPPSNAGKTIQNKPTPRGLAGPAIKVASQCKRPRQQRASKQRKLRRIRQGFHRPDGLERVRNTF